MIGAELIVHLARMSARIGADRMLVQGPGGNSSIKDSEELWVKASGAWLAEAEQRPIFVPVALAALRDGEGRPLDEVPASAVIAARNPDGLKPSIETMLHAIMPHRIVVHAHAVNAMAISVLADGEARAAAALDGLAWQWIDYRQPGASLARAVRDALAARPADILLLQNHGIVIGADDFEEAESLLVEVERRLALPARPVPDRAAADVEEDAAFVRHDLVSRWAVDASAADVLTRFTLFPDQVVFLGGPVPRWLAGETPSAAAARVAADRGIQPPVLLRPGVGAVAARGHTAAAEAMLEALVEVARRLPQGAAIHGLSGSDIAVLVHWDAEQYRRSLDAARGHRD